MAFFTNVVDLQAALSACLTVRDWEVLFEAPFAGKIYLRDFRLFVTIIDHYRQKTKHLQMARLSLFVPFGVVLAFQAWL